MHFNQVYEKYVTKEEKVSKVDCLTMLQYANHTRKGVVDKWGIFHVGIYAMRATSPENWTI